MTEALVKRCCTEAEVLVQVLEACRMYGIDVDRQNTGAGVNPSGQKVRFGQPGNSDVSGMLPDGRKLDIEVKREDFDPSRLRGKKLEHFKRQLARLRRTNEQGGVGFWTDNVDLVFKVLPIVLAGGRVEETELGELHVVPRSQM